MVRTKKTAAYLVSMGKTPKVAACKAAKRAADGSSSSGARSPSCSSHKKNYSGGNPIHPREIPPWQKSITCFFSSKDTDEGGSPLPPTDGDKEGLRPPPTDGDDKGLRSPSTDDGDDEGSPSSSTDGDDEGSFSTDGEEELFLQRNVINYQAGTSKNY